MIIRKLWTRAARRHRRIPRWARIMAHYIGWTNPTRCYCGHLYDLDNNRHVNEHREH